MTRSASSRNGSIASSIVPGSMSGSSPWRLTMRSQSRVDSHFGDSVGARCVCRARKAHVAAEFSHRIGDAFIIGRDNHGVDVAGRSRAAVHVLDHRAARDIGERLSRKAGRRVAGRDDSDSMFMVLKEIADAF